ncbi:DUF4476 domain-containing protein [Pedobacter foliorum]|uniref:DUF4476 domain-containing protein n=1 Tax=Pedobacter foliorum TaxID=2739058 RepID=UPI001563C603|nr:DUF4476 domain-containing protein [Pedobacter foliorum]NRF39085.1 DUF4476 domain-containing protein [Pedobacter foliorum]
MANYTSGRIDGTFLTALDFWHEISFNQTHTNNINMKTLILFIAALLQTSLIFAQTQDSNTELFIEVAEQGKITVYVDNELVSSSKSRFRFYDIENTSPTVIIMRNNRQIAKTTLSLTRNSRTIAHYSSINGLKVINTLPIFDANQYALDNWDGMLESTPSRPTRPSRPAEPNRPNRLDDYVMSNQSFDQLLNMVKRTDFDNAKIKLIKSALSTNKVSISQLTALVKVFNFDSPRLEVAKFAYNSVVDKQNYFKVTEVFDFDSKKDELMDYISKNPSK